MEIAGACLNPSTLQQSNLFNRRDTPSVSLPDRHWLEASLVIPRRMSGGLLFDTGRGHPLDRFRVGCRCGRRRSWFFHDRRARSQEHGSNRQQWSKHDKFFHS